MFDLFLSIAVHPRNLFFAQRVSEMGRISVLIKPRLQKDKFSIYWKSVTSTNTVRVFRIGLRLFQFYAA